MAASIGLGSSISNGIFGAVTESAGVSTTFWWLAAFGCGALALLVFVVKDLHDYQATNNSENTSFFGLFDPSPTSVCRPSDPNAYSNPNPTFGAIEPAAPKTEESSDIVSVDF